MSFSPEWPGRPELTADLGVCGRRRGSGLRTLLGSFLQGLFAASEAVAYEGWLWMESRNLQDEETVIVSFGLVMLFVKGLWWRQRLASAEQHVFDLAIAIRYIDNLGIDMSESRASLLDRQFFRARAALDYAAHAGTCESRPRAATVRTSTKEPGH